MYNLITLEPNFYKIKVRENTLLTSVVVFDLRAQVLSILHNNQLMQPKNFAPDYDIFTGKPTSPVTQYGEVHTGELDLSGGSMSSNPGSSHAAPS